ncbi:terpene synthase [Colletotrichum tofieldiae]|nr:terpene synthase [Colletotrichum tofieldiae]
MCVDQRLRYPGLPERTNPHKENTADATVDTLSSNVQESRVIIETLKGETIHVPNLYDIFKGWPVKANVHYERLVPVVDDALERQVRQNPSNLREKYRKANYARFVSLYYPHPGWEQVRTLTLYIIWLFCWDDAIDQQGTGDLSNDLLRAKAHRDNTVNVLQHVLGLESKADSDIELDQANYELTLIGGELKRAYSHEQRHIFMNQMRRYINSCHEEQTMRLQGALPGIESYSELRHGTAAVWTLCALVDTNDILSLRKEIPKEDSESVVNAIPILMKHEGKSPQQAVDALLAELATSVAAFEAAAIVLEEAAGEEGRGTMRTYCDACRCMVTGSIQFTLESSRYKLAGCLNEDGSLDILL